MRSYVMITADLPLAVLLFFAFVLWWNGYAKDIVDQPYPLAGDRRRVGTRRALLKGPQPIAYFALGVGLFVSPPSLAATSGTDPGRFDLRRAAGDLVRAIYTPGDEGTGRPSCGSFASAQ